MIDSGQAVATAEKPVLHFIGKESLAVSKNIMLLTRRGVSCESQSSRGASQSANLSRVNMSRAFIAKLLSSLGAESRPILIMFLFALPLAAQRPEPPSNDPRDPENQASTNKADMRNREWLMRDGRMLARKAGSGPEGSALPQIKDDFERIQLIDREMIKAVFVDNLVDYQQILKISAEIRKRAMRLKTNLSYPEPLNRPDAQKSRPSNEDEDIKVSLTNLDQSIMSFVTNPIFQLRQQIVESRLAMKATSDLVEVIELTETVKKHAERLGREAKH